MKKLPILLCCLIIAASCAFAQSKTSMDYLSDGSRTHLEANYERRSCHIQSLKPIKTGTQTNPLSDALFTKFQDLTVLLKK